MQNAALPRSSRPTSPNASVRGETDSSSYAPFLQPNSEP